MKLRLALVAALLILSSPSLAAETRHEIGDWSLVERTDDAGSLTCILTRETGYPKLQVAAGGGAAFDGRVRLSFSGPIIDGQRGAIPDAKFDIDGKSWTVEAPWVALGNGTYVTALLSESQSSLLPLLSRGYKLTASLLGTSYTVDLKGSGAAIKVYSGCLKKLNVSTSPKIGQ